MSLWCIIKTMEVKWGQSCCLVTNVLQQVFFCVLHPKETQTGLEFHENEFLNYFFNISNGIQKCFVLLVGLTTTNTPLL